MLFVLLRCIKLIALVAKGFRRQVTELQNDASGNEYDKTVDLCDDCRPSRRHRFLSAGAVAL
jgi:hypothetical protein